MDSVISVYVYCKIEIWKIIINGVKYEIKLIYNYVCVIFFFIYRNKEERNELLYGNEE